MLYIISSGRFLSVATIVAKNVAGVFYRVFRLNAFLGALHHFQYYLDWSESEPNYWNVAYALNSLGQVALVGLADLSARMGDREKAIELATFVAENVVSWRETRQQAHELIATIPGELPSEKSEKAMQSGHSDDLATLVARLLADPDYRDH